MTAADPKQLAEISSRWTQAIVKRDNYDIFSRLNIAAQLNHAAWLLNDRDRFQFPTDPDSMFTFVSELEIVDMECAMLELEGIARQHGARSGFWRKLQVAARMIGSDKVVEYESEFHKALARLKD